MAEIPVWKLFDEDGRLVCPSCGMKDALVFYGVIEHRVKFQLAVDSMSLTGFAVVPKGCADDHHPQAFPVKPPFQAMCLGCRTEWNGTGEQGALRLRWENASPEDVVLILEVPHELNETAKRVIAANSGPGDAMSEVVITGHGVRLRFSHGSVTNPEERLWRLEVEIWSDGDWHGVGHRIETSIPVHLSPLVAGERILPVLNRAVLDGAGADALDWSLYVFEGLTAEPDVTFIFELEKAIKDGLLRSAMPS